MFSFVIALPVFVALCIAAPQQADPAPPAAASASRGGEGVAIPIVSQTDENNPDGSFQFSFETGNGIKVEEKGYLKDGANASEKIQVIEGSVSYTDNEGNAVNLKYIADENGFQPQGDHIPKAPDSQLGSQPNAASPVAPQPYSGQPAQPSEAQPTPAAAQPTPVAAQHAGGAAAQPLQ